MKKMWIGILLILLLVPSVAFANSQATTPRNANPTPGTCQRINRDESTNPCPRFSDETGASRLFQREQARRRMQNQSNSTETPGQRTRRCNGR